MYKEVELNNNQKQVLISGIFGDGQIVKTSSNNFYYSTSCIHKEYLIYKSILLGELCTGKIGETLNKGFKEAIIYNLITKYNQSITRLNTILIDEKLEMLDELGLALWFYDDGSLHKKNLFYNLNTQAFSKEIQETLFIPFLRKFGVEAKVLVERKKDGKIFYYLYISKHSGAFIITSLLRKYYVSCFEYKMWSENDFQNWLKAKTFLEENNKVITPRLMGDTMKKYSQIH